MLFRIFNFFPCSVIVIFTYDTLDYKSDSLPLDEDISIPNLEITVDELNPENIFTPGYGSSIGILTKKAAVISLQKSILDDQLTFKLTSLLDIDYKNYFHHKEIQHL